VLQRLIERFMRLVVWALGAVLMLAVALNLANVIGRYVFGTAIQGADEIQVFVMVWMTFLGVVAVTWREQHLRMDVLVGFLPRRLQTILRIVETALLAGLAGFVVVQSGRYVALMIKVGRTSEAGEIPMAIPHAAVTIGFALVLLLSLVHLRAALRRGKDGKAC
jgi:TRAP-type C4-dicarboxylate transport system permease small subunit